MTLYSIIFIYLLTSYDIIQHYFYLFVDILEITILGWGQGVGDGSNNSNNMI